METNGISLFDQQPEEPKKDRRTAFLLGGIAALGVAGALGVGFVIGGRGSDGPRGGVDAASVSPTQQAPVSPTAKAQTQNVNPQPAGQAPAGNGQNSGGEPSSNAGDTSGAGDAPAPADPPPPPAPTNTPVPPTNTPVPPTSTPTSTPAATAVPPMVPCPWCPDPPIVIIDPPIVVDPPTVPCPWCPIIDPPLFDPGIILHLDSTPPVFTSSSYAYCPDGYHVSFEVNESAEMWVSFETLWADETAHASGTAFSDVVVPLGFIFPHDFVFHAKDAAGNEATMPAPIGFCF